MARTKESRARHRAKREAAGITRYFGGLCGKHPGLNGERLKSNRCCVGCHRARQAERNKTPAHKAQMAAHNKTPAYKAYMAIHHPLRSAIRKGHISKFATPKWLTDDDRWMMREIYSLRILRNKLTGIEWHVDHEIPLKGKNVCGLHVPGNLQLLSATNNLRKGVYHP